MIKEQGIKELINPHQSLTNICIMLSSNTSYHKRMASLSGLSSWYALNSKMAFKILYLASLSTFTIGNQVFQPLPLFLGNYFQDYALMVKDKYRGQKLPIVDPDPNSQDGT